MMSHMRHASSVTSLISAALIWRPPDFGRLNDRATISIDGAVSHASISRTQCQARLALCVCQAKQAQSKRHRSPHHIWFLGMNESEPPISPEPSQSDSLISINSGTCPEESINLTPKF